MIFPVYGGLADFFRPLAGQKVSGHYRLPHHLDRQILLADAMNDQNDIIDCLERVGHFQLYRYLHIRDRELHPNILSAEADC